MRSVACDPPSGYSFPIWVTSVECSVTDIAGTIAGCSFDVTVEGVGTAHLTIHSRECPSDAIGGIFDACHDNIADGIAFDVSDGVETHSLSTDENGEGEVTIAEARRLS